MKKQFKIISIFMIIVLLFSFGTVLAGEEDNISLINADNVYEQVYKSSDVYLIDKEISINEPIDGNVFLCANTVTINSEINGDVFIIANDVIIDKDSVIYNNLFSMTNHLEIRGVVNEAFSFANTFSIAGGYIYRDLKVSCKTLDIRGSIGRNAFVNCENITFDLENSTSIVYGDLNYSSPNSIDVPEGAVQGLVNFTPLKAHTESISDIILDGVTFIILVLLIALVCLWLAPNFNDRTKQIIENKKGFVVGFGFLGLLVIPIACLILLLLRVTSTAALLLLAFYILALVISKALFIIVLNNYICDKLNIINKPAKFGILAIISLVIWLLSLIPYLGAVISFIIIILGLGILILNIVKCKY